jgi:nucleotide-binding universal stress UspA family protein
VRPRKILCPIDFSAPSREALRSAADLARQFDASLSLLHVYQVPALTLPDGVVFSAEVAAEAYEQIDKHLAEWQREATALGAPHVDTATVEGTAWRAIVDRARSHQHDLIVIGTRGRTGLAHVLVGSVAERVVQHAPCPVLALRKVEKS